MGTALLASEFMFLNWFDWYNAFDQKLARFIGDDWLSGEPVETGLFVVLPIFVLLFLIVLTLITRASWKKDKDRVIPEGRFSVRNLMETVMDTVLNYSEMVFGSRKDARRFLPLIGGLAFYIVFGNAFGLVPFVGPSTSSLNVTIGPAVLVFLATHYVGVKEHGLGHFKEFLGPKIGGGYWLFFLFIPLELVSHFVRPVSLSLRLMGNLMGDHMLIGVFLGFGAISILPIVVPFFFLGTIVTLVQTLVFCMLSIVYIKLALAHGE